MDNDNPLAAMRTGHPAPHRARARLTALLFGICAAPAAWNAQILFSSALSGFVCYPHATPLEAPLWGGSRPLLVAVSIIGMLVAIAAGLISWRSWSRTSDERPGSFHHLLELGEGRTRFMATVGMLTSALFLIALAFELSALCLVPSCGG
jgi:uncharacterized membrane protein YeiB